MREVSYELKHRPVCLELRTTAFDIRESDVWVDLHVVVPVPTRMRHLLQINLSLFGFNMLTCLDKALS